MTSIRALALLLVGAVSQSGALQHASEQSAVEKTVGPKGRCMRPKEQLERAQSRLAREETSQLKQSHLTTAGESGFPFGGHKKQSNATEEGGSDEKVEIAIYYEALCPYCKILLNTSVKALYEDEEMSKRIVLKLYPYGNAQAVEQSEVSDGYNYWHEELKEDGYDYVFSCQHGEEECFGNLIQACALDSMRPKKSTPFLLCMEGADEAYSLEKSSYECAQSLNMMAELERVKRCTQSSKGNQAMLTIAETTETLVSPAGPHEYVPWVVLNGEHSEASEQDADGGSGHLLQQVCSRLKAPLPSMCEQKLVQEKAGVLSWLSR